MAVVSFKKGTLEQYTALAAKDAGTLYFVEDTNQVFVGDTEYTRPVLSGTAAPAESLGTKGTLYIQGGVKVLLKGDTAWTALGDLVKSFSITGSGNVITGATFTNGVLTLTKGITAATSSELSAHTGNKVNPHGVTAAQVGAYTTDQVDQKIKDNKHTHDNKTVLDGITEDKVTNWDDAHSKAHTHSADHEDHKHENKALLDTYTQTNANLADAVSKKHSHTSGSIDITGTKTGEKVVSIASGKVGTTLSLAYDSTNKKIQLKGISDAVVAELDATAFIKDGMVSGVSFAPATKTLTITFNTDAGKEAVDVDLTSLVDTYTAGNGITISGNKVSLKVDSTSQEYLTVGTGGLKLSGVQGALTDTQKGAVNSGITSTKVTSYDNHVADGNIHVTAAQKTAWSGKQDKLTFNTAYNASTNKVATMKDIQNSALVWGEI